MVPLTSSPPSSFTRTGVALSMRLFKYLASSNVCSGARPDFPACSNVSPLLLFLGLGGRRPGRFRAHPNVSVGRARGGLDLIIIAVARRYPQFGPLHTHFERVETVLARRRAVRVETQH